MDIVYTCGSWSRSPGWLQLHSSCLGSGGWDDNTRPRAAHAAFATLNAVVEGGEVLAASTPRIFPTLLAIHPEAHSFFLWLACVFSDRRRRTPCFLSFSCPFFSLLIPMPSLWCYRPFSHLFIIHYGLPLNSPILEMPMAMCPLASTSGVLALFCELNQVSSCKTTNHNMINSCTFSNNFHVRYHLSSRSLSVIVITIPHHFTTNLYFFAHDHISSLITAMLKSQWIKLFNYNKKD